MTRFERIVQNVSDFNALALWIADTATHIEEACPQKDCRWREPGVCEHCPTGWRWALRAEMKEDKS